MILSQELKKYNRKQCQKNCRNCGKTIDNSKASEKPSESKKKINLYV